ncbi:MAG: hypothetical protein PHO63_05470 [Bacilli bacterium]|nr:hypothetical protein [Bacilli bacterium]MDD4809057.1 hypothetical protein [Bacilli bacterium]
MPSWSIHLALANKISKKINIDKDLFFYGSLIPDVNNKTSISRFDAHFYGTQKWEQCPSENKIDIERFLKTYQNHLHNSLILGYYAHLLTDNYYNGIVYSKCWVKNEKKDVVGVKLNNNKVKMIKPNKKQIDKQKYKHLDFELYGKYILDNYDDIIIGDSEKIINNIKYLCPPFLNEELVRRRISYLNGKFKKTNKLTFKEKVFKYQYNLLTHDELNKIFDECCDYVIIKINELEVNNEKTN